MKILLEKTNSKLRDNDQYSVEVKSLAEARDAFISARGQWGASDYQYQETGTIILDDGTTYYISFNGRIWDGKYGETSANEIII